MSSRPELEAALAQARTNLAKAVADRVKAITSGGKAVVSAEQADANWAIARDACDQAADALAAHNRAQGKP